MKMSIRKLISLTSCLFLFVSPVCLAESNINVKNDIPRISKVKKGNAYIPEGTILEVETSRTFSSKNFKEGDTVPLRLAENLVVNDVVVAPRFSRVRGIVTKARRASGFGVRGKLEFKVISVRTINGVDIPLRYSQNNAGSNDDGAVAVAALVSLVGGAFMKGTNVTIHQGTRFSAEVAVDTDLETSLDNLSAAMNTDKPQGTRVNIGK